MGEEYHNLFRKLIAEPLERVLGSPLQSVVYYVLHVDCGDFDAAFDVDDPNASGGCQGVHLTFANGEVEFDWDWRDAFRPSANDFVSSAIAYHLVARPASERRETVRESTEDDCIGLKAVDAAQSVLWREVAGEPLMGVTLWGVLFSDGRYSPQAAELLFPSGQTVVTIGMTDPLSAGDGDEVLVIPGRSGHKYALRYRGNGLSLTGKNVWSRCGSVSV